MLVRQVRQERDAPQGDQHRHHDEDRPSRGVEHPSSRSTVGRLVGAHRVTLRARRRLHPVQATEAAWFLFRRGLLDSAPVRPPDQPKDPAMISLQHVTKVYRNRTTALEDVTVEVEKGEFVFIVGQSGSGKSTFIRLLLREEEAAKGDIYVAGKNLAKLTTWKVPHLRRNIGTVFQDFKLLQDKTVFENVAFALEVIGKPKHVIDQRVPEILELRGARRQAQQLPRRALRRRAAARLDRAGVRQPSAGASGRRADGQPRPLDLGRDHARCSTR